MSSLFLLRVRFGVVREGMGMFNIGGHSSLRHGEGSVGDRRSYNGWDAALRLPTQGRIWQSSMVSDLTSSPRGTQCVSGLMLLSSWGLALRRPLRAIDLSWTPNGAKRWTPQKIRNNFSQLYLYVHAHCRLWEYAADGSSAAGGGVLEMPTPRAGFWSSSPASKT